MTNYPCELSLELINGFVSKLYYLLQSNNTTYLYDLVKLEVPGTDSHFEKGEFQVLKGEYCPFYSSKRKPSQRPA